MTEPTMDSVQARAALLNHATEYHERSLKPCCLVALDAYGDVRGLEEHVKACVRVERGRGTRRPTGRICGDSWLCDVAKAIKEKAK